MLDLSIPLVCLALNVYHEARSEPYHGKLAVALTTLNRAHHRRERVCSVVFAPSQFTWTNMPTWAPTNQKAWTESIQVAKRVWQVQDFTCGATHYYAPNGMKPKGKVPDWVPNMTYLGQFGAHRFYKKGEAKCPVAFYQ